MPCEGGVSEGVECSTRGRVTGGRLHCSHQWSQRVAVIGRECCQNCQVRTTWPETLLPLIDLLFHFILNVLCDYLHFYLRNSISHLWAKQTGGTVVRTSDSKSASRIQVPNLFLYWSLGDFVDSTLLQFSLFINEYLATDSDTFVCGQS